jgi:hypothetical protein
MRALLYRLIISDSVRLMHSQLLDRKTSPTSGEGISTNLGDTHQFLKAALSGRRMDPSRYLIVLRKRRLSVPLCHPGNEVRMGFETLSQQ